MSYSKRSNNSMGFVIQHVDVSEVNDVMFLSLTLSSKSEAEDFLTDLAANLNADQNGWYRIDSDFSLKIKPGSDCVLLFKEQQAVKGPYGRLVVLYQVPSRLFEQGLITLEDMDKISNEMNQTSLISQIHDSETLPAYMSIR